MEFLKRVAIVLFVLIVGNYSYETVQMDIDTNTNNELLSRLHVKGGMGNNITLISNIPLGAGSHSFVLPGEIDSRIPVALKFSLKSNLTEYETNCYKQIGAQTDRMCEKYGIPFIYHDGDFLHYNMVAMTVLDMNLKLLREKVGPFSRETILIIARDMVKTFKYIHSKGIVHEDVKPHNIMVKGANVFLCDFNQCDERTSHGLRHDHSKIYGSLAAYTNASISEADDFQSFYYTMLTLADVELPWGELASRTEILMYKLRVNEVENLINQVKHSGLAEQYKKFYAEIDEAYKQKRLPRYDYLYHMFDDALYGRRNRSERIVFEWLSPEEKSKAMLEEIPTIESIFFSERN